jgi:hypothetical protein
LPQILALSQKPAALEDLIQGIMLPSSAENLLAAAERLASGVRQTLSEAQASLGKPVSIQEACADDYFFIVEHMHKVLAACAREEPEAAASAAFQMQEEISQWLQKAEKGYYPTGFNQLGEYLTPYRRAGFPDLLEPAARGDLVELAERVRQLEAFAQDWLQRHGVALNILADYDALRAFLRVREPERTGA